MERMTGFPADYPPTQSGDWLRIGSDYADCYAWWDRRRYRVSGRFKEYWYYWKCRLWRRWNVVTIRTLPPTWNEHDERILHAVMEIFCDFYEADRMCADQPKQARAFKEIHDWWRTGRQAAREAEEKALMVWHEAFERAGGMRSVPTDNPRLNRLVFGESEEENALKEVHTRMERENNEKDQAMLHRVINLRPYLWD